MAQKRSTNAAAIRTAAAQAKVTNAEEAGESLSSVPKAKKATAPKMKGLSAEDVRAKRIAREKAAGEARQAKSTATPNGPTQEEITEQAKARRIREENAIANRVETVKPGERTLGTVAPLSESQRRQILISKGGAKALQAATSKRKKSTKPKFHATPGEHERSLPTTKVQPTADGTTPVTYRLGGSNPSPEQGPLDFKVPQKGRRIG